MAASEEHDSQVEALQPAVEEETKTFKDLVRVVATGLSVLLPPDAGRVRLL